MPSKQQHNITTDSSAIAVRRNKTKCDSASALAKCAGGCSSLKFLDMGFIYKRFYRCTDWICLSELAACCAVLLMFTDQNSGMHRGSGRRYL